MDRAAAYRAAVDAVYRQYAIDHGYARMEILERETFTPTMRSKETEDPERNLVGLEDRLKGKGRPTEAAELANGAAYRGVAGTTPVLVRDANGPGCGTMELPRNTC